MRQLFTYHTDDTNEKVYEDDFVSALRSVGVVDGDVLFVHSDITTFGKKTAIENEGLLSALIKALTKSVGESGTIAMPTFTYSFCERLPYNVAETPSTVGVLGEFFRKQHGVTRTRHPIFSVAICGKKKEFLSNVSKDSFGDDSIFGRLRETKAKLIFFGASFHACTFIHHIEQMHGVSYRYMKTFSGTILDGEKTFEDTCTFFVRRLDREVITDTTKLEARLRNHGALKEARVGGGVIMAVEARTLFTEGMSMLDADPHAFILNHREILL